MCSFFSGLEDGSKLHLNACLGGAFLELSTERCTKILEGIANNPSNLDIGRGSNQRVAQIEESEALRKLFERVDMLENVKVVSFQQNQPPLFEDLNQCMNQIPQSMEEVNFMGRQGYQGQQESYGQGRQYQPQGTYQSQGQYHSQGGGSSYNPNARKHENFSYSNPKTAVQFSPSFDPGSKLPTHEGKATNEDALALILRKMEENRKVMTQQYKNLEAQVTQMNQQQKAMEFQMGQLATTVGHMQNKGPPLPNEHDEEKKEDEIEQEVEDDKVSEKDEDEEIAPFREDEEEKGMRKNDKEEMKRKQKKDESAQKVPKWKLARDLKEKRSDEVECDEWGIPKIQDRVPFPQRFVKKKLDKNFAKFLEVFKRLHINIPFYDALEQMPNYAKEGG
ncbi:hypothetical protein ACS0TY_011777 [Phlomoides rotata]